MRSQPVEQPQGNPTRLLASTPPLWDPKTLLDLSLLLGDGAVAVPDRLRAAASRKGAIGEAIRVGLWAVGSLQARLATSEHSILEFAGTYLATVAECGNTIAYEARAIVLDLLGASKVGPAHAATLGAELRPLRRGQLRHGDHAIVPAGGMTEARATTDWLASSGRWSPPPPPVALEAWVDLEVTTAPTPKGIARCPWHDDARPSALLRSNGDGTGHLTCLVCPSASGGRLTGFWKELPDGRLVARTARPADAPRRVRSTSGVDPSRMPIETVSGREHYRGRRSNPPSWTGPVLGWADEPPPSCVAWVSTTARPGRNASRRSPSASRDLVDLLIRWDRLAAGPAAETRNAVLGANAGAQPDPKAMIPDLYTSIQPQRATLWVSRRLGGWNRLVPREWRDAAVTHIAVDLDDLDLSRVRWSEVGDRVRDVADRERHLESSFAVTRTGPRGVQAVFRLARAAEDSETFFGNRGVRDRLARFGAAVLEAIREAGAAGGHVDPAVWRPQGSIRRPGLRWSKQEQAWTSRVVFATRRDGSTYSPATSGKQNRVLGEDF